MRNLRVYLKALEESGHLKAVTEEVDCSIEAATVAATSYQEVGPALHFQKLKDYSADYSLASGIFSGPGNLYYEKFKYWSRTCIAMGVDPDMSYDKFMATCMERVEHPILPVAVESGPVKEVVMTGDEIDVTALPIPFIHPGDGGRYSTLQIMMVKDFDSDWVVWENVRTMVVDGKRLVSNWAENSRITDIFEKYKAVGRSMPFAIVMGGPPLITVASFLPMRKGTDPAGLAGGLNLDPIELVASETSNIMVPAQAEVVIEGEVSTTETHLEGPFPDFWFYTEAEQQPILNITAITQRKDPIIPFSVDGVKPSDRHILQSLMISFEMQKRLVVEKNMPVMWVQLPIEFNFGFLIVCGPPIFPGFCSWLSKFSIANAKQLGSFWNKIVIVDDKTNPDSLEEVIATFMQRAHAQNAYHMWDTLPIGPNDRSLSEEESKRGAVSGVYIDTFWPMDWAGDDIPRRCNLEGSYPKELIEKVAANYNKYGFDGKPQYFESAIIPF